MSRPKHLTENPPSNSTDKWDAELGQFYREVEQKRTRKGIFMFKWSMRPEGSNARKKNARKAELNGYNLRCLRV